MLIGKICHDEDLQALDMTVLLAKLTAIEA